MKTAKNIGWARARARVWERARVWAAAAVVVVVSAGCANREQDRDANQDFNAQHESKGDFFQKPGADRVAPFANVQAANGARHDAMLYKHHFSEGQLNSLGRSKVLLMLEDCESCTPATVYLVNCGDGELLAQRKASVELYLATADGRNPNVNHPAAAQMARLPKTELGTITVEPIDAQSGSAAASGGGGSTSTME